MQNKGQVVFAVLLIAAGLLFLLGNLFSFDVGNIFWPLVLITLGLVFIFRSRNADVGQAVKIRIFGETEREGAWEVEDEELWSFIGELNLDLTQAKVPEGEAVIRMLAFISDVDLLTPKDVGVKVETTAFLTDAKMPAGKEERFLSPYSYSSPGYEGAKSRLRVEVTGFVVDLKVKEIEIRG